MIEFNGWISISSSVDGEHTNEEYAFLQKFTTDLVKQFQELNQVFEVKNLNGEIVLITSGRHNHDNGRINSIKELLEIIGQKAIGSYGLIFYRLSEHPTEYNQFNVLRLARGKVSEYIDTLLSPCNPVIEE